MHILGAIAEFERERIRERVLAGLRRAKANGQRLGRPKARVPLVRLQTVASLPTDDAARTLGVSRSTLKRWRRSNNPSRCRHTFAPDRHAILNVDPGSSIRGNWSSREWTKY